MIMKAISKNKYCLILGGNSGLGQALAGRFAQEGFNLLLTSKLAEKFDYTFSKQLMERCGISVSWLVFDGLNYASHPEFYHGLPYSPEVVIMAIGYLGDQEQAQNDFREVEQIMGSNLLAQVSILNVAAQAMEKKKAGSIIGISSVAGERGRKKNYFYGAAKAGFSVYLSGLRNRLYAHGVQVLTVLPGYLGTKMLSDDQFPGWLVTSPTQAAEQIFRAFKTGKKIIYVSPRWRWIMKCIKLIPESVFCRTNI